MTTAYPLSWPPGHPRAKTRETGTFKTTLTGAIENVKGSLNRFANDSGRKVENIVFSSNVTLGMNNPPDPGVAVWFIWDGDQLCIPVDRYKTPAANLQAIHYVLEARRVELRHGTLALVKATFHGFKALPNPEHWSEVLGVNRTARAAEVEAAFTKLARIAHPDVAGGSHEAMARLTQARDNAIREIG